MSDTDRADLLAWMRQMELAVASIQARFVSGSTDWRALHSYLTEAGRISGALEARLLPAPDQICVEGVPV